VLAVGVVAQGAFSAYNLGLPALGPELQSQFRAGLTQTGALLASTSAGVVLTLLAWGLLTDRWPAGFGLLALLAAAGWWLLGPLQAQERAGWERAPALGAGQR
jgi:hypothetical protein